MDPSKELVGDSMQLLWHSLVNVSFGYLTLIAMVRIAQELKSCVSLMLRASR